jgi:hypothetical protein
MSNDRSIWGAPSGKAEPADPRAYKAYESADRAPVRLEIVPLAGMTHFPAYANLLDIVFDHHFASTFALIYSFTIVEVQGENLGPVVQAVASEHCKRITQFDAKRHDAPKAGAAIIRAISVTNSRGRAD